MARSDNHPQDAAAPVARGVVRWGVKISDFAFCLAVIAVGTWPQLLFAQSGDRFKAAPQRADAGAEAGAADSGLDMILGVHVNTIFFVAAAVIALFWFTLGGGRKPKVTSHN